MSEARQFRIGYARVSTNGQSLDAQLEALQGAGCHAVFAEKATGGKRKRPELAKAVSALPHGGVLVVTRLDRLGRNISDIWRTAQEVQERGAALLSLAQPWADQTTPTGKLLLSVLAWAAEIERDTILERTAEGLARAKAQGRRLGRPRIMTPEQQREAVRLYDEEGRDFSEIAALMRVHRSTVSRFVRFRHSS